MSRYCEDRKGKTSWQCSCVVVDEGVHGRILKTPMSAFSDRQGDLPIESVDWVSSAGHEPSGGYDACNLRRRRLCILRPMPGATPAFPRFHISKQGREGFHRSCPSDDGEPAGPSFRSGPSIRKRITSPGSGTPCIARGAEPLPVPLSEVEKCPRTIKLQSRA